MSTTCFAANFRHKDDVWNAPIGGFAAGLLYGMRGGRPFWIISDSVLKSPFLFPISWHSPKDGSVLNWILIVGSLGKVLFNANEAQPSVDNAWEARYQGSCICWKCAWSLCRTLGGDSGARILKGMISFLRCEGAVPMLPLVAWIWCHCLRRSWSPFETINRHTEHRLDGIRIIEKWIVYSIALWSMNHAKNLSAMRLE